MSTTIKVTGFLDAIHVGDTIAATIGAWAIGKAIQRAAASRRHEADSSRQLQRLWEKVYGLEYLTTMHGRGLDRHEEVLARIGASAELLGEPEIVNGCSPAPR